MFPDRFVVAVALLSIIGCAPDEIALVSTGPLDDLVKIPQDATAFAETGGPPILEIDERRCEERSDEIALVSTGPLDDLGAEYANPARCHGISWRRKPEVYRNPRCPILEVSLRAKRGL